VYISFGDTENSWDIWCIAFIVCGPHSIYVCGVTAHGCQEKLILDDEKQFFMMLACEEVEESPSSESIIHPEQDCCCLCITASVKWPRDAIPEYRGIK